jgi:hypothetical protein
MKARRAGFPILEAARAGVSFDRFIAAIVLQSSLICVRLQGGPGAAIGSSDA